MLPIDPTNLLSSPIIVKTKNSELIFFKLLYNNYYKIQDPIYGEKDPQFISFMAPGIMMTVIFTVTLGLTALMFVIEKKEGLHERGFVAGVTTLEIMLAHVTVKLMIMVVQIVFMMIITIFAFDVSYI